MMMKRVIAAMIGCVCFATPALADEGITYATSVSPAFVDGALRGCSIVFDVLRRDPEYSRNAPVQVSGSLTLWSFENTDPRIGLKIGVSPLGGVAVQAPAQAYLVSEFGTNIKDKLGDEASDTPGFRMFAFVLGEDSFAALLPMIERGTFRFAYAMPGGSTGAVTAVDLNVSSIVDGKQVVDGKSSDAWGRCFTALPPPKG
jgi:hypothetical protein